MVIVHCRSFNQFIVIIAGLAVGCISPLEACMVPSSTMKPGPQGEGIQVGSSSGASGPCF